MTDGGGDTHKNKIDDTEFGLGFSKYFYSNVVFVHFLMLVDAGRRNALPPPD